MATTIYWPKLCGDETIYDAFWSYDLTLNTSTPDVTSCFENTALTWLPGLYLLLISIPYMPYCRSFPTVHKVTSISKLCLIKTILTMALSVLAVVSFVSAMTIHEGVSALVLQALIIDMVVVFVISAYTQYTYRKGFHTSGVLLIFWFLLIICDTIKLVSYIYRTSHELADYDDWIYHVFYARYALELLMFVVSIPSDMGAIPKPKTDAHGTADEKRPLLEEKAKAFSEDEKQGKPCPQLTANFLSRIFFAWFNGIVIKGYKAPLHYDDIWDIRPDDSSEVIMERFLRNWNRELKKAGYQTREDGGMIPTNPLNPPTKTPSLAKVIGQTFLSMFAAGGIMLFIQSCIELLNPQILSLLIAFVEGGDPFVWHGYVIAVLMFCTSAFSAILMHNAFNCNYNVGARVRTAITGAIYRKSMRLTSASRKNTSAGEITNLMSVDAQKMQDIFIMIHYIWVSPCMIAIGTYSLWTRLGVASIAGIVWYAFVVPMISILSGKFIRTLQFKQMKLKDARIKLMNQVLTGIKVLKLYGWEPSFEKRISDIRETELKLLRKAAMISSVNVGMSFCSSFLASLVTFVLYIFTVGDGVLPADVAFVSLSLLNALAMPIMILPGSVMGLVQGMVSIKRITKFLLEEEVNPDDVTHEYQEDTVISIQDGSFSWGEMRPALDNINLSVPNGSLVAVVGQVGQGKSSFISAMMGEMTKLRGKINVDGSTAYVPQQAWIQNMTLRDNILFTKPYVREKYQDILTACALQDDLKILVGGDMIEIGERGINLSGGQKQRVALARACYQNSDIYLLDDPLSAVDSHVGKSIFDKVIGPKGMLRNKTRIFVTNSVAFLSQTDLIVCLGNGVVSEMGKYEELLSHNGAFAEYIATYLQEEQSDEEEEDDHEAEAKRELMRRLSSIPNSEFLSRQQSRRQSGSESEGGSRKHSTSVRRKSSTRRRSMSMKLQKSMEEKALQKKQALITEEGVEEGNIQFKVIKTYMLAASMTFVTMAFLGILFNIAGNVGSNIWLSEWSNDAQKPEEEAMDIMSLRIGIYTLLGCTQAAALFMITAGVLMGTVTASRTLHKTLLSNILKTPMAFFDTTPLGRIINRFSKDIDTLDDQLRMQIQFWMMQISPVIATIVVISYSTPIFIAVVVPLLILFTIIQRVYVATARQLKRIDSVKRSPVYANFTETLNGISSIRAYEQQQRFVNNADTLLDNNQKVWFAVFTSNRWIGVLAQVLGNSVVFFAAIFSVVSRETLDPGTVGLSLTYALSIGIQIVTVLRTTCELETYIVAVERIDEYAHVPTEAEWHNVDYLPPPNWPDRGTIEFNNYCLRYRPGLDLVLKGVNCTIKEGEKVGIVGRTGAGKSSLTVALFRITEGAGGSISIDDYDLGRLGLHDIRTNLTIIPQDPVVFSGSLRFNIDPSGEHSDQAVWNALENSHLKPYVASLNEGLHYECGEDGQNMSVGQRQLLCLARALLRRSKILVLDEATAAVDLETDDLIQSTIRREFKDCTIMTIAHRLNTIMDYDRVMVMDKGMVAEFDTPTALLEDTGSIFHSMAKDAGLA